MAQEALAIATNVADEPYRWRALAILGAVELAAGEPSMANQYFDELRSRRHGNHGLKGAIRSEGDEVEALLSTGRVHDAETVSARLSADEDTFGDPWQRSIGARCRGLVASVCGELDAAVREFELALIAHQQLPMPLELARTLLAYGTVLRRAKQKRAARERVQGALEIFASFGSAIWIKRAEAEVGRIAPAPSGVSTLTPTEARVAALVASGRTNKEVAAALSLSVKTIEANLSRIYDKLNLRSRSQLIAREASHR
jgi:DNA-binding CsgD family transcriptional regulator